MRLRRRSLAVLELIFVVSCARVRTPSVSVSSLSDANDPCYMCHIPFTDEEIAVAHLTAGIPCSRCHGKSLAHMGDETFSTPPDTVYSRDQVNPFCRTCHATHPNIPPERLVEVWLERNPGFVESGAVKQGVVCTDCHGSHRLARAR